MATEAAHLRTVEQFISSDGGNPGIANLPPATGESGGRKQYMHSAHAENAHADERAVSQCN